LMTSPGRQRSVIHRWGNQGKVVVNGRYLTTCVAILIATKLEEITQQPAGGQSEDREQKLLRGDAAFQRYRDVPREVAFLRER